MDIPTASRHRSFYAPTSSTCDEQEGAQGRRGADHFEHGKPRQEMNGELKLFEFGDKVLLVDSKKRRYLVTLKEGGEFHSHSGFLAHGDIVGQREGSVLASTKGSTYFVLRPTLEDFVVEMPRGAQVIYPKDLATICMVADIAPGVRVFESGVGSGALSMAMLRAGANIVGYELREDFANRAQTNVRTFLGAEAPGR
ncbi:MAG: hypothetical protein WC864_08255, partial [Ilumatobacteraceae bacterium]